MSDGKGRKTKQDAGVRKKNLSKYLGEFCELTSIQGFSFLVKDSSVIGRIWWILVIILGIAGSYHLVYKILDKYWTTPVMVTYATKEMSISEIPFPAVTICPEAKVSKRCLNYAETLKARKRGDFDALFTDDQFYFFDLMGFLCKPENHEGTFSLLTKWFNLTGYGEDSDKAENMDYVTFLQNCASIDLEMTACRWIRKSVPCSEILRPILTEEGLCYSFNMYGVQQIYSDLNIMPYYDETSRNTNRDWNPDKGFDKNTNSLRDAYPRRAFLSGTQNSLDVVFLTLNDDVNYACRDFSTQGIRVSLHVPVTIPRPSQLFYSAGLNRVTLVSVTPTLVKTSRRIQGYDPETRNCYFGNERRLKYFRYYTQSNCNSECWVNYTISKCDCVSFYMPRDNSTRTCSLTKRFCLEEARKSYSEDILRERLTTSNPGKKTTTTTFCRCLPLCSDLQYYGEISTTDWDFNNADDVSFDDVRNISSQYSASAVRIFFNSPYFLPIQRDELYGVTDMVSNIGGVLGLITGFSLFSLAELIYFASVRLFENYRKYGHWAGAS